MKDFGLRIFAKRYTDEKAMVPCVKGDIGHVMVMLNEKYGGDWVFVDELSGDGEILRFSDGMVYHGYHGKPGRYSAAICRPLTL